MELSARPRQVANITRSSRAPEIGTLSVGCLSRHHRASPVSLLQGTPLPGLRKITRHRKKTALRTLAGNTQSNEITAIPELLKVLDVKGCVVTIDAMGCQKEIAKQIAEQGGDYVLALKGNQGILHKEVELLFKKAGENNYEDLPHDTHTTVDGGHGRVETRTYTTIGDVDWFEDKSKWPRLTSFGMAESQRDLGDRVTEDTRYFISSLPNDAIRFAEAVRGHWGVENSLHWCLDIAFREDDSRVRKGHGATNLAILRRFALSLIKQDPARKVGVKASRKRAGWDNNYLLHLLRI